MGIFKDEFVRLNVEALEFCFVKGVKVEMYIVASQLILHSEILMMNFAFVGCIFRNADYNDKIVAKCLLHRLGKET